MSVSNNNLLVYTCHAHLSLFRRKLSLLSCEDRHITSSADFTAITRGPAAQSASTLVISTGGNSYLGTYKSTPINAQLHRHTTRHG